jgi:peptide/nickel transport system substrate-binding protein
MSLTAAIALATGLLALVALGAGPARAATAKAAASSTLVVAEPNDIQNLDPTLSSGDITTQEMLTNVYGWMVNYKVVTQKGQLIGDANSFVGDLAKSLVWNKSRTVLTMKLRPGLKFANGDPINAAAVKFSYDRAFGQKAVTSALLGMAGFTTASRITTAGPMTVKIHLTKANSLLYGNMAQFGNSILDPTLISQHTTKADPFAHTYLSTNVGGGASGPYQLASWQPGVQWTLTANPNYQGSGPKPKIKTIIFKVVPDPSTRYELLQSGAVDMAYDLPLKDIKAASANPQIKIVNAPSRNIVFLGMNNAEKPFNNVKVRQAIDYAVPYKTILSQVLDGYGQQMTSPVPVGTPTHTDKYDVYQTNIAKAKALLKAAGYPNGFSTTLDVSSGNEEGQETAIWVQQSLKEIGINVTIDQMPGATYTAKLQKHQLGFFFFNNWISINNDPFYHLYWMFDSSCCDYVNYKNPTVTKLINQNLLSTNTAKRDAASMKIQKTIMQDAPWAFLYQPNFVLAMRSDIKGYVYFPADTFTRYQYLSKTGS